MSLIHPLKFRTWETGHFKTPRLQTSRLQMGVFQTVVAVAFELCDLETFLYYLKLRAHTQLKPSLYVSFSSADLAAL